jgi:hypothetical protein
MVQNGPVKGGSMFAQGKLSPLLRAGVSLASGVDYMGRPLKTDWDYLGAAANNLLPMPFGISGAHRYLTEQKNPGIVPTALIATGAATYSRDKTQTGSVFDNTGKRNQGNILDYLVNPKARAGDQALAKIQSMTSADTKQQTAMKEALGQAIKTGQPTAPIFNQYRYPGIQRSAMVKSIKEDLKKTTESPLQQTVQGLSKAKLDAFLKTLPPDQAAQVKALAKH